MGNFTSKKIDRDTGLYYFNARWYDPQLGRFITEDPVKDGLAWYAYANNNPLRFVDPTGLKNRLFEDLFKSLGRDEGYEEGTRGEFKAVDYLLTKFKDAMDFVKKQFQDNTEVTPVVTTQAGDSSASLSYDTENKSVDPSIESSKGPVSVDSDGNVNLNVSTNAGPIILEAGTTVDAEGDQHVTTGVGMGFKLGEVVEVSAKVVTDTNVTAATESDTTESQKATFIDIGDDD